MYQFMVFKDPAWDYKTLNFDAHMAQVDAIENGAINALEPNLKPFVASKGKMIRLHVDDVTSQGRNTMGVRIIDIDADDQVGSIARVEAEQAAQPESASP